MKKIFVFACAFLATVSAHAIVTPIVFFATPPILRENFDTMATGMYTSFPAFSGLGVVSRIGTGSIIVSPYPGVNTIPNLLYGNQSNVQVVSAIPMRRFGGYFNSGFLGVFSSTATFRFFDASGLPIGSATVPLTTTMTWHGFKTTPKWKRVEIYGNIAALPGAVGIDSLRIRPI